MSKTVDAQRVIEEVERAFGSEPVVPAIDLVADRFRSSEDADELVSAVAGKHWTELDIETLFHHREALGMLSAAGYRALLSAFIRASLTATPRHGPDLIGYTVSSLHPLSQDDDDVAIARDRLALLSTEQRTAIAVYLRYLADDLEHV